MRMRDLLAKIKLDCFIGQQTQTPFGMSFWRQVDDPWTDPKTLDRRSSGKGQLYNGEGSLLFPAMDYVYGWFKAR